MSLATEYLHVIYSSMKLKNNPRVSGVMHPFLPLWVTSR